MHFLVGSFPASIVASARESLFLSCLFLCLFLFFSRVRQTKNEKLFCYLTLHRFSHFFPLLSRSRQNINTFFALLLFIYVVFFSFNFSVWKKNRKNVKKIFLFFVVVSFSCIMAWNFKHSDVSLVSLQLTQKTTGSFIFLEKLFSQIIVIYCIF